MTKMTAVEWLEKELKDRYALMNSEPLFQQALEIEKQQIKDAFIEGHNVCRCVTDNTDEAKECFEEWFKTFKKYNK